MTYQHDEEARQEAAAHALDGPDLAQLAAWVAATQAGLGPAGWRGQSIPFNPTAWTGLIDGLRTAHPGQITRGEVLDLAARGTPRDVFIASFVWGSGLRGYGATRLRAILADAGPDLDRSLAHVTAATGPIARYAGLYGGYDAKRRARPGDPAWGRLNGFGPAFFTKFVYFTTPGALILDHRLAAAVHQLTAMPYLITPRGQSYAWSPYRYAVYLHWMHRTAERLAVEPDLLELTLFDPPKPAGHGAPA